MVACARRERSCEFDFARVEIWRVGFQRLVLEVRRWRVGRWRLRGGGLVRRRRDAGEGLKPLKAVLHPLGPADGRLSGLEVC